MALSLTKCFYLYCSLQSEQIRAFISTMFLFQTLPSLFKFPSQRQEKSHNSIELIGKRKKSTENNMQALQLLLALDSENKLML